MSIPPTSKAVESLEPEFVWRFFGGLSAVPRPSKKEERVREYVHAIAREHDLKSREDGRGNVLIEVPASAGCEQAPITVLQGHLDMVCEKNTGTVHDFERDPIKLVLDQDAKTGEQIIRADGTTLGADNGMGVAFALAAALAPGVVHGPLELLFTVDEEAGMTGAMALDGDLVRGKRMLNLDTEEDDTLYIGCAGGCDSTLVWELDVEPLPAGAEVCRVFVTGLCGGHSGADIHRGRGNAIKLQARTMLAARSEQLRLVSMNGGSLRNAIPREAEAVIAGPAGTLAALEQAAKQVCAEAARECAEDSPSIVVEAVTGAATGGAISAADTERVITSLAALPHGVLGMHAEMEGLVETSNNVATAVAAVDSSGKRLRMEIGALSRSASDTQRHVILRQIAAVGKLAGAEVTTANEYPGWAPDVSSALLGMCQRVYEQMFGEPPNVTAIHAGLECGIIGQRTGGMETVSFGPHVTGGHSPDECVYVASVQKVWKYLQAVLKELATG
ncbi:MAG: aminoacyl-histidine dipeptidase [bacterium]|nr:aminoacyl-histidine dipeptidase [bacterium]